MMCREDFFDALIVTGAPVERLPFEEVAYWSELTEILDWSLTHCFRRLGICWGAQALLYHFKECRSLIVGKSCSVSIKHQLNPCSRAPDAWLSPTSFPMPVSRYTEKQAS
jgi:homoserine O-succinyltransferase